MKNLILISFGFMVVFDTSTHAVTLDVSPSGASCRHVHVVDEDGQILEVTTIDDILSPIRKEDTLTMIDIKSTIIESKAKTIDEAKTAVAGKTAVVKPQ